MNPLENVKTTMNRFCWVDNLTIKIINEEGTEKLIDLETQKELAYNVIPLFDPQELEDPKRHYYNNRVPMKIEAALDRMKRKYQNYKSAYYIKNKEDKELSLN